MTPAYVTVYYFHEYLVSESQALLFPHLCVLGCVEGIGLVLAGS